jgi:hypothetical protein
MRSRRVAVEKNAEGEDNIRREENKRKKEGCGEEREQM